MVTHQVSFTGFQVVRWQQQAWNACLGAGQKQQGVLGN